MHTCHDERREIERLRDVLSGIAASLEIDGENHAASVRHARDALRVARARHQV